MTVAHAFARALRAAGLERVYGLPGEDHLRVLDALEAEGLTYVAARDEGAATIMACAEAQATGRPGVVLVTIAPGLTNAINGLAHAWLDGVPLLVVCGQHHPERAPLIVRQGLNNHRLVEGLTKWSVTASARIHQVLAKALEVALAPPSGPVFLELRDDITSLSPLDSPQEWPLLQSTARSVRVRASSAPALPEAAVDLLARAARPALVIGAAAPRDALTRTTLASAAMPVFTSPSAMGLLRETEPWFAGTFMNGNLERQILGGADLIITVGLDARDFFNAAWRYQSPIVAVNEGPDAQRFAPVQLQLLGDTCALLSALAGMVHSEWTVAEIAAYRRHVEDALGADAGAFTIPAALRAARRVLPPETLVAVDAGFGKPLASYVWSATEPNQYFTAHGLSTMGFALPAATALQLLDPQRPVVGFMGDGSLLMRASEITVAVDQGVAPIYVAWMDGSLAQIETKQLRQDLRTVGAHVPAVSCAKIADAFGGMGYDVHTLDDFVAALRAALTCEHPTLIGAHVDQTRRAEWYELLRG